MVSEEVEIEEEMMGDTEVVVIMMIIEENPENLEIQPHSASIKEVDIEVAMMGKVNTPLVEEGAAAA